mgnify:CR=1 FL=1
MVELDEVLNGTTGIVYRGFLYTVSTALSTVIGFAVFGVLAIPGYLAVQHFADANTAAYVALMILGLSVYFSQEVAIDVVGHRTTPRLDEQEAESGEAEEEMEEPDDLFESILAIGVMIAWFFAMSVIAGAVSMYLSGDLAIFGAIFALLYGAIELDMVFRYSWTPTLVLLAIPLVVLVKLGLHLPFAVKSVLPNHSLQAVLDTIEHRRPPGDLL